MESVILIFKWLFLWQSLISFIDSKIILQQNFFNLPESQITQKTHEVKKNSLEDVDNLKKDAQNQMNGKSQSQWMNRLQFYSKKKGEENTVKILDSFDRQNSYFSNNQRLYSTNYQGFSDQQQSSVYTNKLSLLSSLGTDIDSKIMEFVKWKISQNKKRISRENQLHRNQYQLTQNKFIIYSSQQFKQLFLTLQEPNKTYVKNQPSDITVIAPQRNLRNLQELNINWKQAKKMTSVKYQKQCGACYSFTSLGAIESAYLIKGQNLNLAQQQIIDCSTPYNNYGCIGGWTINAYKYVKDFGVLFQSDYPYKASQGKCSAPENKKKYKIKNYVELSNDCNIVIEALKQQPLSIAVNADGWQYYSSGIYTDCRQGPSNHGVILAGVDQNTWLIKNSWGFTWGEQGYIRISRNASNQACNVCRWASYPVI